MKELAKENIVKNPEELSTLVFKTLEEIKVMIKKNQYILSESSQKTYDEICRSYLKIALGNCSYKTIKKVNRNLRWWSLRPNRHTANRFLHLLRTRVYGNLKSESYRVFYETKLPSIKILPSLKEQIIQKKREVWKKLNQESLKALSAYKKEKGDFYKARLFEKTENASKELSPA